MKNHRPFENAEWVEMHEVAEKKYAAREARQPKMTPAIRAFVTAPTWTWDMWDAAVDGLSAEERKWLQEQRRKADRPE
jgi:hypothetical protein